jgi:hypothetical protein
MRPTYLWVGEAGGWDGQVVQHVRAAADVLNRADALRVGRSEVFVLQREEEGAHRYTDEGKQAGACDIG